jgi:uncharacterized Zn-binding protein involved in type VI secretion
MPGITRKDDTAGGAITNTQGTVRANGRFVIVDGDPVEAHGPGVHASPTMVAVSKNVFIGGKAVVNAGDLATCGDEATGSTDVRVGNP